MQDLATQQRPVGLAGELALQFLELEQRRLQLAAVAHGHHPAVMALQKGDSGLRQKLLFDPALQGAVPLAPGARSGRDQQGDERPGHQQQPDGAESIEPVAKHQNSW